VQRPGTGAGQRPGQGIANRPGQGGGGINNSNIGNRNNFDNNHINIDNEWDIDGGWDGGWGWDDGCCGGFWAGAAAGAIASDVWDDDYYPVYPTGTMIYTLPPACTTTVVNGVTYEQCGDTYYEPSFYGTDVTYTVADPY
jgi:hypothetical protein